MTALRTLDLSDIQITDLTPLAGMVGIDWLLLDRTQITDLTPLAGMVRMRVLSLTKTKITDLAPLAGMVGMQHFWLDGTAITDLTPLAGIVGMQSLRLDGTQITDLTPLAGMMQLRVLVLRGSQVADLRPIAQLQRLETDGPPGLAFANTPATAQDARLAELAKIINTRQRAEETLAYLRSLPPWVDPAQKLSEALPLAEDLVQNPATGAFDVRPRPVVKPDLYAVNLEQVADALADVLASPNNGLNATSPVVIRLKRTLDRYANDPQRIEMDFTSAHRSLTRQMTQGDLPVSDENQHLQMVVLQGAQGIRATHPEIYNNRQIQTNQALREMSENDMIAVEGAASVIEAITEGDLQPEMAEDIEDLTRVMGPARRRLPGVTKKDAMLPWPDTPHQDAAWRFFNRVANMAIKLRGASVEVIKKLSANPIVQIASLLTLLQSLVQIGLSLLG